MKKMIWNDGCIMSENGTGWLFQDGARSVWITYAEGNRVIKWRSEHGYKVVKISFGES